MGRTIGAVVVGVVVLGVVVITLQALSGALFPLPAGIDPMNPVASDGFEEHVATLPPTAWLLAWVSEVLGAFLGATAAARIAGPRAAIASGLIVLLALAGSIMNWTSFAHPIAFIVGQLVAYPVGFALALRLGRTSSPSPTQSSGVAA